MASASSVSPSTLTPRAAPSRRMRSSTTPMRSVAPRACAAAIRASVKRCGWICAVVSVALESAHARQPPTGDATGPRAEREDDGVGLERLAVDADAARGPVASHEVVDDADAKRGAAGLRGGDQGFGEALRVDLRRRLR